MAFSVLDNLFLCFLTIGYLMIRGVYTYAGTILFTIYWNADNTLNVVLNSSFAPYMRRNPRYVMVIAIDLYFLRWDVDFALKLTKGMVYF